jgi:hypothetical protein
VTKAELHELVDALPHESLGAAGVLLRRAQDPVVAALNAAPHDDEDYTPADEKVLEEVLREPRTPWERAKTELEAD